TASDCRLSTDCRLPIVKLGYVAVVARAQEADVGSAMVAAHGERVAMVELEPVPFGATSTALVDEAAAIPVALVHSTPHGGRDVARGRGGIGVREPLAGRIRLGVAPSLEPLELLG